MTDQPDRILRLTTVLERTGLKRATLYRKMKTGQFPKNMSITERCVGWHESAIAEWIKNPMFYSADNQLRPPG